MKLRNKNYGIIGVGMMGQEHIKNILQHRNEGVNCSINAICDIDRKSLNGAIKLLKNQFKDVDIYLNYEDLINDIKVNIIIIATPNNTHYEIINKCLNKEKSILVEKPVCTTLNDCINIYNRIINIPSYYYENTFWIGMEYKFMEPIKKLIEFIDYNKIGNVKMISIREHRYPFLVKVNSWNTDYEKTGGTFVEKCCHFFHLMYLIAKSRPISVYASGNLDVNNKNPYIDNTKTQIIDNGYVIINFENGIRACLDLCMFAECSENQQEICVVGDKGKIESFIPSNQVILSQRNMEGNFTIDNIPPDKKLNIIKKFTFPLDERLLDLGFHEGATYWEHHFFINSFDFKKKPEISLESGIISVIIGIMAETSIKENRLIFLSEFNNQNILDPLFKL